MSSTYCKVALKWFRQKEADVQFQLAPSEAELEKSANIHCFE